MASKFNRFLLTKGDAMDDWGALRNALEKEASLSNASGPVVQVMFDPESELILMLSVPTKSVTVTYVPERNAVKWETATEYGFEPMKEPMGQVAATLMKRLLSP